MVVGGANWDTTWVLPRIPAPGETVTAEATAEGPGGKGLNIAVALALLRADVALVASLGDDDAAAALALKLTRAGVSGAGLRTTEGPSGRAAIWVSGGESRIAVVAAANAALDGEATAAALEACGDGCELLILQAEVGDAALLAAARWAARRREAGAPPPGRRPSPRVLLSAAPARPLPQSIWRTADLVVCNRVEAAAHSGVEVEDPLDAEEAAVALSALGPEHAVVTLGSEGAVVSRGTRVTYLPPFSVPVVDPTGAGDCFAAAFARGLIEGFDVFASAGYGMAAAAVCVGRAGAATAMPTLDEVERMAHSVDLRRDAGMMPIELPR